jgi:uncharacterized membrane protein
MADRERDLDRLLTFVDAVVAIAITLLVLPLAEVGQEVHTGHVAELLSEHADDVAGFLLSFAVIARLWLGQHAIVSSLVRQSPLIVWLLLAWTLTIVFLPFPTSLVTATTNDGLAKLLYIGTMTISSALLALLAWSIRRDRSLRDSDEHPDAFHATVTAATFAVVLVISVVFPATNYWPLLLLLFVDTLADRLFSRRTKRAQPAS